MIFWLDFRIFGNGHGICAPFFDGTFYWLVDTYQRERNQKNGQFYKWIGGFGAQLNSFEGKCPLPGTKRMLFGREFVVFQAHRKMCRWDISWTVIEEIKDYKQIDELKNQLRRAA